MTFKNSLSITPKSPKKSYVITGGVVWAFGWLGIYLLDGRLDLGNLGMMLVLISAVAAMCLPFRIALLCGIGSVLLFNLLFIPPRGSFLVNFQQHALMLLVMLVVNIIIATLMAILRSQSERASRHAAEAGMLRDWGDRLHGAQNPHEHVNELQQLLMELTSRSVSLLVLKDGLPLQDNPDAVFQLGDAGIEQKHALWHCLRNNQQLGRGTGQYEIFSDIYLPLRARDGARGAVLIQNFALHEFSTRIHLQAICDQMGNALERYRLRQQEIAAHEQVQSQLLRNNLLAAISHDYRTPLATIMGAASSLNEQIDKLDLAHQHQLAQRIFDEAARLNTITGNILQLARLDSKNEKLDGRIHSDWQSVEEILGDVRRRWRNRNLEHRLQIQYADNLPLLWCDAVLIGQLLENLIGNALKYSPENTLVHVSTEIVDNSFSFIVADRGPGIDFQWRERIFEPFQRASQNSGELIAGAGVGLALCRAIARAHGGELSVKCPSEGGSRFLCSLPLKAMPTTPEGNQQ